MKKSFFRRAILPFLISTGTLTALSLALIAVLPTASAFLPVLSTAWKTILANLMITMPLSAVLTTCGLGIQALVSKDKKETQVEHGTKIKLGKNHSTEAEATDEEIEEVSRHIDTGVACPPATFYPIKNLESESQPQKKDEPISKTAGEESIDVPAKDTSKKLVNETRERVANKSYCTTIKIKENIGKGKSNAGQVIGYTITATLPDGTKHATKIKIEPDQTLDQKTLNELVKNFIEEITGQNSVKGLKDDDTASNEVAKL